MPLIYSELGHLFITLLIGAYLYKKYRLWFIWPAVFLTGFLLDIDHLFDYFLYYGPQFSLDTFLQTNHFVDAQTVYVPLHSWEISILLIFLGIKSEPKKVQALFLALGLSLGGHLIWDQITNPANILAYSFIYRILNNFTLDAYHGL